MPLIAKIMARVNSWVSNSLSFAGRLLLVKSTLASMQVFWCSAFLLPVHVTKECERLLRRFLWGGHGLSSKASKVKWSQVCKPFPEGGLGIKELKTWNLALLLKQICLWMLPSTGLYSLTWRNILIMRSTALNHLVYECCKGDKFSLWFDPWLSGASIHALYGHQVIYDAAMTGTELVKDVSQNDQWCWPQTSRELIEIQQRVQCIPISSRSDRICYFSTKQAWQAIRSKYASVTWHKFVWHPYQIPKHSFFLWLAILGVHKTLDKLLCIGIVQTTQCIFSCGMEESRDHLLFQCPYTNGIWKSVLCLCNLSIIILPWTLELQWMVDHSKGKTFSAVLRKIAAATTVYHI
ncbi:zf-RVT domain-containing protein [Cephalotus follicularis]|uniref:Zf-RVT domain-containing protein n=1 Tax=Cephalotus follicularis TaxID=3775 RepID=A0A1Q3DF10_CEPFO|nr:zf-RVT domain-containing protein [Cephalotus follicularis]